MCVCVCVCVLNGFCPVSCRYVHGMAIKYTASSVVVCSVAVVHNETHHRGGHDDDDANHDGRDRDISGRHTLDSGLLEITCIRCVT